VDIAPKREKAGFQVPVADARPERDFTFEAFFQVRSIYESGSVRTIASQRDGNGAGWAFGVTGKGSRRKPRTMVIQLWGRKRDGSFGEAALFSGADVTLGHTYHAAVAVRLADAKRGGTVTFYLRDLTSKDAPTQVVVLPHEVTESVTVAPRLVIGGTGTGASSQFDGLLDEVRWHAGVLAADQLAAAGEITREDAGLVAEQGELIAKGELDAEDGLSAAADATSIATSVRGYWPFASAENWQRDASSYGQHILPPGGEASGISVMKKAWSDLCHAVLNSNEFLYVE
jgi:hypothetical protein